MTNQCENCGIDNNEDTPVTGYGKGNIYLCEGCKDAIRDHADEQETQQCTTNWVVTGKYL